MGGLLCKQMGMDGCMYLVEGKHGPVVNNMQSHAGYKMSPNTNFASPDSSTGLLAFSSLTYVTFYLLKICIDFV